MAGARASVQTAGWTNHSMAVTAAPPGIAEKGNT